MHYFSEPQIFFLGWSFLMVSIGFVLGLTHHHIAQDKEGHNV